MSKAVEDNAFFWQYWVAGGPGYLLHNVNYNLALVNGSPINLHSVVLAKGQSLDKVIQDALAKGLPFGSEIEIDPPFALNIIIEEKLDGKPLTGKRRRQLKKLKHLSKQHNIDPESSDIILPITQDMKDSTKWKTFKFLTGNPISPVADGAGFPIHPQGSRKVSSKM